MTPRRSGEQRTPTRLPVIGHCLSRAQLTPSLAIINGASGFGRIVPVLAAQWVGFINIHMTFAVCSSIMLFCWTTADSVPGVLAFDATYGVISGEFAFGFELAFLPSLSLSVVKRLVILALNLVSLVCPSALCVCCIDVEVHMAMEIPPVELRGVLTIGAFAAAYNPAAASFAPHPDQVG